MAKTHDFGALRVGSGALRGRTLTAPGGGTHPMGAREKGALFNMIAAWLPGAVVLDAFAGSGALGTEALSRGAARAVLVEKEAAAVKVIRQNLAQLDLPTRAEILHGAVEKLAKTDLLAASGEGHNGFDVVLADPPYDDFRLEAIEKLAPLVRPGGVLVLSHPDIAPALLGLKLASTHRYAAARLSVYTTV